MLRSYKMILVVLVLIVIVSACGPTQTTAPIPEPTTVPAPSVEFCVPPGRIFMNWSDTLPDRLLVNQPQAFSVETDSGTQPIFYSASIPDGEGSEISSTNGHWFTVSFDEPGAWEINVSATNACGDREETFYADVRDSVTSHLLWLGFVPITSDYIEGWTIMTYTGESESLLIPEDTNNPHNAANRVITNVLEVEAGRFTYTLGLTTTNNPLYLVISRPGGQIWLRDYVRKLVFVSDEAAYQTWDGTWAQDGLELFLFKDVCDEEDCVPYAIHIVELLP